MNPSAIHYEPQPESTAHPEDYLNQLGDQTEWALVYSLKHEDMDGLDIGLWSGRWGGFSYAGGTFTLTDDTDNYIVVLRSNGVPSISTSTTNWNSTSTYARVYKITTVDGAITAIEDHRGGPSGIHGGAGGSGGATAGKHMVYVSAAAMRPSVSGGCAALASIASAANQPDIVTLDFDPTTTEYAQFAIAMPESWNEGTVTFKPVWSHASGGSGHTVAWALQGVAVSNDDTIAANFGTAQASVDAGGTANDIYIGPESSAITLAGTPQAGDMAFFRIAMDTDDSSHTLASIDGRLHGIRLYITTDADTDA